MAAKPIPPVEIIHQYYIYNPMTGTFTNRRTGRQIGEQAPKRRYYILTIEGLCFYAHRVAWVIVNGPIPDGFEIDHQDGNGRNNRATNLRLVTHSQNMRNSASRRPFKGISKVLRKYGAWIWLNGKSIHIGNFTTEEEAHAAYCAVARKHFGEFWNDGNANT